MVSWRDNCDSDAHVLFVLLREQLKVAKVGRGSEWQGGMEKEECAPLQCAQHD